MAMEITDSNYAALLAEGKPMILDFWATWCGPCQLIGPMIEELAEEFNGQIIIGKVDVDSNTDLPGQFGIRNIPTLIFIKNGEIQKKLVGAQQKSVLVEEAKKLLA
ncbi:thioredoxin [Porphyromonas gingivicanis]|uniref:Thioredoxin n=1 Tax=Porphyromonas gingivicanis TaxID=266762 RepID=A0A0A2G5D1_9PORP|nr:thioredoxin [Porphyromonas gingivicanis]KGN97580.1 thioredoxin [Porphyromonas gingivicanis]